MTVFDWVNQIKFKKDSWNSFSETDKKSFQPYMINRILSMNNDLIPMINECQKITHSISKKYIYKLYCNLIPRDKKFYRYIKNKKDINYNSELIDIVCKHFRCSKNECKEYLNLFFQNTSNKLNLELILIKNGIENKKIRKLLK